MTVTKTNERFFGHAAKQKEKTFFKDSDIDFDFGWVCYFAKFVFL